jgi:hypothetical protein
MLHEETTRRIIKAFYKVYNTLGYGFLEKVYERALAQRGEPSGRDLGGLRRSLKPANMAHIGRSVQAGEAVKTSQV